MHAEKACPIQKRIGLMKMRLLIGKRLNSKARIKLVEVARKQMNYVFHKFVLCLIICSQLLISVQAAANERIKQSQDYGNFSLGMYERELEKYATLTKAVSGGYAGGNRVSIRIGSHTFFDKVPNCRATAGLYVVAIHRNEILLQNHYNTYTTPGASEGFAQDIEKLPDGSYVVVAAKDEPTKFFDRRGQEALYQIGAKIGLAGQKKRTSYLCLGIKGLARGNAIEKAGMELLRHTGSQANRKLRFIFPKTEEPQISTTPGRHEGLMRGQTEVIYYIPKDFDPNMAKYLFGIHGAGDWHRPGAMNRIAQFRKTADKENLVVIAPAFDCIVNRPVDRKKELDKNGKFKDLRIVKEWYLRDFQMLLNQRNEHRSDLKLIEIFELFNKHLMRREKFHLYGHSGGGQFVSRFILFHPELVNKVAISSGGSYPFPRRDIDYPYGLKMNNLEKLFGPQIKTHGLKLSQVKLDQKLSEMLDLKLFIIAGENDAVPDNRPERSWQGKHRLERAMNFHKAMKKEDERLKEKGIRPQAKPYNFELHVMPGIGHDSSAAANKATELLFP